jgi:hypothetical protein
VEAGLKAMWSSATRVQDLVLGRSDRTPPLAISLLLAADLIEGRVDFTATNRVRWGPVGTDRHLVALPRVGDQSGADWV